MGAKRKTKPPAQKRDIPHGGPPKKKKAKVEKPSKTKVNISRDNNNLNTKRNDIDEILQEGADFSARMAVSGEVLLPSVIGAQAVEENEWVEQLQPDHHLGRMRVEDKEAANLLSTEMSFGNERRERGEGRLNHSTFEVNGGVRDPDAPCGNDSLESALNFKQIFTTIDDNDGSDQVVYV